MEPVRPVSAPSAPPALEPPPRPVAPIPSSPSAVERPRLEPAVSLDLSAEAAEQAAPERRGYDLDTESRTLVYRVTDPVSGDVIVQIPDEIVLKARVYARQDAAQAGAQVERRA